MSPIKVAVQGALGKVGQEVVRAVSADPGMTLVGALEASPARDSLALPDGSSIPLSADADLIFSRYRPEAVVDFSIARATVPLARAAARHGVNLVIGTTCLSAEDISEIGRLAADNIGAVVAPNFALGAVLMIHLAKIAGKFLDSAEIIELHHNKKVDAPSGTALATARAMAAARGRPFQAPGTPGDASASRGQPVEGINIHSLRLPGLLAHQEVILGGAGQTLSIRHDTISRECYIPGVLLAVREVVKRKGLVYGLDTLLGL
ncbi:MAG: 4-hydroxy-tetrahydrodipicolinate reductase [Chloroflexi bacterium]|nr:4-hydroxy-tetrahydrodipicolinate reductase [Chloroflexota bacterium]